jgi:serine/threonine protein kinase
MALNGCEELMQAWFPITTTTERKSLTKRKSLTESDIRDIAQVLIRTSNVSWSRIPRIYSVLRIIDQLHAIDSFLTEGITDVWLPFSQKSLPASFQTQSARLDFLDAQQLVFNTKALNLERKHTRHGHFTDATEVPLKKIGELGKGGYGFVDRVVSTFSHREYARKLIPRGRTFKKDKQVLQAFERELSSLKSISQQHMHIVDLVGSYTDPKYVGIIMLPVADCNLHEFLLRPLDDGEKSLLRTFFGCLTSALCFLHDSRIRHKDIKPQNVLIKSGHVFLTDFGVSLDWSELSHSTTTGPTSSTPRYGAPEVAEHSPRNSSADIWSLGCVFLEIWTVLKKEIVQTLHNHMASSGTLSSCYYSNLVSIGSWIEIVKGLPGPPTDNVPSAWITQMLKRDREARWTAHTLAEHIHEYSSDPTTPFAFAGLCCLIDDDTAESVHSSIGDDMNGLTLQPTISPVSRLHHSEPMPLLRQTEAATICEVPITIAPYIKPRKRVQISPHQIQPSLSSSADPGYVSRAIETSDTLGRVPLPGNLLSAAESYSKEAVDIPGQLDMRKSFQDQSHRNYPPQPYVEEEEAEVAPEIHTTVNNPAGTHVWPSENDNVESSDSKRWVFFTSGMDERPSPIPRNNINTYPKVPEMIYHSPRPTSGKKYYYPTPSGGVRLGPDVVGAENGHRVLPRPSRNQTYSPSPLPSSPTILHKENLR